MFLMTSHDQILDKHTIVDMFLMTSHDQILDKHTIVDVNKKKIMNILYTTL
jgi:hypothetical protein